MSEQQTLGSVPWEYQDSRGIKIADADWDCPDCNDGRLMHRPGSKDTCATCFYVVNGRHNAHRLSDYALTKREAQQLLAEMGEPWHGTPGDIENRLRYLFDSPAAAAQAHAEMFGAGNATKGDENE